ncbi:5'-nucleotidase [Sporothrix brasiliensis 5110]|uniref:5'-nucleotidase n=1 Tax=Sporothrix brasiliensis 5110 TaxID=1398154 RepID=A0A0C2IUH6_9PEZI|nr:5'-nucleotidase [Sporothrix brasiliensis 5110]KIH92796.1 5'-nucleotidase [Sporothrix brasiliensis 5110]
MKAKSLLSRLALAAGVRALNVLITNDDGFGTANIRAMYYAMTALGHNCYIVASSSDQSGQGSRLIFASDAKLTGDSEFGIVKSGAPSIGTDPHDDHIWYYNGSPATQVLVALDYVLPKHANFSVPDLVLAGPNYGPNVGPFLYGISGTLGATQTAIARGIPALAFAGTYGTQTAYYDIQPSTKASLQDPATIMGRLAANLAQAFIDKAKSSGSSSGSSNSSSSSSGGGGGGGERILPLGYGVSVNFPLISSFDDDSCVNPPFVRARMTGDGAFTSKAVYNSDTGLFGSANFADDGTNMCINGDCSLPGEVAVLNSGCKSSVALFTIDYDAPYGVSSLADPYAALLPDLVQLNNATNLVGGLGANASVAGGPNVDTAGGSGGATSTSSAAKSGGSHLTILTNVSSLLALASGVAVFATWL